MAGKPLRVDAPNRQLTWAEPGDVGREEPVEDLLDGAGTVEDLDAVLTASAEAVKRWHDPAPGAMVRVALAPCSPFSVTGELMRSSAELGRELGVRLHTHLAETRDEVDFCRERFGCTPTSNSQATTTGAAVIGPPRRTGISRTRLPVGCDGCSNGVSGSSARRGSVSAGSTSYSTAITAAARRAVSGWSAATSATGSPWYRTTSSANAG